LLEHFHEGNLTYRVKGIRKRRRTLSFEISPELAQERGVQSGTWLLLISRYGQFASRALVTDLSADANSILPMNSTESPVNRPDQQHYRSVLNAGLQGSQCAHAGLARDWRESAAARESSLRHPTPHTASRSSGKWKRPDIIFQEWAGTNQAIEKRREPWPSLSVAVLPTRDPREERASRLDRAPLEHADALIAHVRSICKGCKDSGVLKYCVVCLDPVTKY